MRKKLVLLLALTLCLSMVLSGCGGGGVATNNGEAGGTSPGSGETFTWKVQGYTTANTTFDDYGKHWAELVETMSGGRLKIEWYPADSLVSAFDVPNAVRDGILDAEYGYSGLWTSLEYGAPLFCSIPGEFSDQFDMLYWLQYGGGMDIWREMLEPYNVTVFPAGILDAEIFLWTNKPIKSMDDLKSMKLRMMPLMGDILAANDCSVVFLPGGEIIPSMERSVIDAGEFSTPALDETFGFQDVAKYYHKPGFHQPTSIQELVINKDSWNKLPADLQAIVEAACNSNVMWTWMENGVRNQAAMERFSAKGVEEVILPDEVVNTLQDWTNKWFEEKMKEDPFIDKVRKSQMDFMKSWVPYKTNMNIPYPDWAYELAK